MSALDHILGQLDRPDHEHAYSREDVTNARAEAQRLRDAALLMRLTVRTGMFVQISPAGQNWRVLDGQGGQLAFGRFDDAGVPTFTADQRATLQALSEATP